MSTQGSNAVSRLTEIKMRYQQKQVQDNVQKKNDLFSSSSFDDTKLLTSSLGAGKVRQMFQERRVVAGIDKSFPLDPIVNNNNGNTRKTISPPKSLRDPKLSGKVIVPPLQNRSHDINGNTHFTTSDPFDKTIIMRPQLTTNDDNEIETRKSAGVTLVSTNLRTTTTKVFPKSAKETKLVTRKLTPAPALSSPVRTLTPQKVNGSSTSSSSRTMASPIGRTGLVAAPRTMSTTQKARTSAATVRVESQEEAEEDNTPVPDGLVRCSVCKRNFAEDRIEKHQVICFKSKTKKRRVYDSTKSRVVGTEAETYLKKPIHAKAAPAKAATTNHPKKENWRSKHEDFIKTIRAAKEMQAYLAKGGKLSDLPPPPPSVNADYVECPYCNRRFNSSAADRHIPICKNMLHNKPKAKPMSTKMTVATKRR
ncbi:unnamed protein product [Diamesa tonsa]